MDWGPRKKPDRIQPAKQQAGDQERVNDRKRQREKMLVSAAQLFREKGIAETTLDEIAAGVGLTKPRLYYHFEGKREIVKSCIERALCQWKGAINEIRESRPVPNAETLKIIVRRYADVAFQDFGMCVILNGIRSLRSDERGAFWQQKDDVDTGFKSLLANAISREIQSRQDPEFLWLIATSLVHGIALRESPPVDKHEFLSKALVSVLAGSNIKA